MEDNALDAPPRPHSSPPFPHFATHSGDVVLIKDTKIGREKVGSSPFTLRRALSDLRLSNVSLATSMRPLNQSSIKLNANLFQMLNRRPSTVIQKS
ncbi:hypothetical protein Syun_018750 [Stephania yunnanensis]|uniref:Uncharacterized protein n=1 Tax=Stephania yunnanensis TaxID=152371 RepID=A0AAP0NW38_9MAGN